MADKQIICKASADARLTGCRKYRKYVWVAENRLLPVFRGGCACVPSTEKALSDRHSGKYEFTVRFTLYTDKTVRQCMSALADRMEARPTRHRPALDGYIEKGGTFSLSITRKVGIFPRRTRLRATASRSSGVTTLEGFVASGAPPGQVRVMLLAIAALGVMMLLNGNAILSLMTLIVGVVLYVSLTADYHSSDMLLKAVRRACNAKDKPPS